jgi:hypothetical protein
MTIKTFDVVDLVSLIAGQRDWDLSFDSGPGDIREFIYSRTNRFGIELEITVEFDFAGRIERSEYRRAGQCFHRNAVDKWTTSADVHTLTLDLFDSAVDDNEGQDGFCGSCAHVLDDHDYSDGEEDAARSRPGSRRPLVDLQSRARAWRHRA